MISPTAVLDVKASFFRFTQLTPGYSDQARAITPASIGMTQMIHAPTVSDSVIPNINISGFTGSLFGSGSYSWSPYNRWIFSPNLTLTRGKHSLHFGFEYDYEARGSVNPGNAYGTLRFGPELTRMGRANGCPGNGGAARIGHASGNPSPEAACKCREPVTVSMRLRKG